MKTSDPTERQKYRQDLACSDFRLAKEFAQHLIKKKWHKPEWRVRPATRIHQTAYTTAFVVTYCRPFTKGDGWKILDIEAMGLTPDERLLHGMLLELRHKVHAHTDHEKHDRQLWKATEGSKPLYIITRPAMNLTLDQIERAIVLLDKLLLFFQPPPVIEHPSPDANQVQ